MDSIEDSNFDAEKRKIDMGSVNNDGKTQIDEDEKSRRQPPPAVVQVA